MFTLKLFLFFYFWLNSIKVFASEYGSESRVKELFRELGGSHLHFSATHLPPFLDIKQENNGTFSYEGLHADICEFLLARPLNMTFSFVNSRVEEENKIGLKEAAVSLLMRDEVDVVTFGLGISMDHCTRMRCSVPLTMSPYSMVVPWPEEESRVLIKSFQPMVFTLLVFVITAITLVLILMSKLDLKFTAEEHFKHSHVKNKRTSASSIDLITILTNHDTWVHSKHLSFRIVLASWCLGSFILYNTYASDLISIMVVPKLEPVFKSFDDLASGYPKLKILTEKNTILPTYYFLNAESGPYKVIGDSLRKHPETLFTNREKAYELMDTGHYAYATFDQLACSFMHERNKKAGYCRFTISNKNLPISPAYVVYTFRKHWRYSDALNYKIQLGWESGLLQHWIKKSQPNIDNCLLNRPTDINRESTNKKKKLSLINLLSPFLILLIGLSLSFLVFLVELIWDRFKKHRPILNVTPTKSVIDTNNKIQEEVESRSEESTSEMNIEEIVPEGQDTNSEEIVSTVDTGEIDTGRTEV